MRVLFLSLVLILSACQSLPRKEIVQVGDSTKRLLALHGEPTYNLVSMKFKKARAWYYVRGEKMCGFAVRDETIIYVAGCGPYNERVEENLSRISKAEFLPEYQRLLR